MNPEFKKINYDDYIKGNNRKDNKGISTESYSFLEEILYSFISRKEISKITHNLMNRFNNSTENIFKASIGELMEVDGIEYETAVYLSNIPKVAQKYNAEVIKDSTKSLIPYKKIKEFLVEYYSTYTIEVVVLLCLNVKLDLVSVHEIHYGSFNSCHLNLRKIFELTFLQNAASVIIAHNHPCGLAFPSREDIETTRRIYQLMTAVDIDLAEHYVIAGTSCYPIVDCIKSWYYH